ncbi:hypothetical protein KR054_009793 [Drosophila jambulina]|nr:hypothetical protein KR054_009793 [Drosophila jambulina]
MLQISMALKSLNDDDMEMFKCFFSIKDQIPRRVWTVVGTLKLYYKLGLARRFVLNRSDSGHFRKRMYRKITVNLSKRAFGWSSAGLT